jgi:hypothetical protein
MELEGLPITSAAIPDLKLNPRPTDTADTKKGNTAGKYIAFIRFHLPILNTFAISSSFSSVLFNPYNRLEKDIGIAIKNDINTERFFELIQTRAKIINDATGVDLIIFIKGEISSYISLLL